ncbi:unnamed protein product [Fraxinus pennsylvanica]|uniref:HhH-GPD domain-containing protein n=1 Tax=Fraxinus pennsylvanica TaxID=56036 RepID=A0AAD2A8S2_9LAMI|nr:unnamed protein product [Fraxinus pennsylvanica]
MELGESAKSFNLETVVCNHGFFMMAPNYWIPTTKTLMRVLRLSDSITCVIVSISHPSNRNFLQVEVHGMDQLSSLDKDAILSQVGRMLRISAQDERDMEEFHKVNPQAKNKCFGRLFRSPTLFEDVIKSILLCNCPWIRSLQMAQALCDLQLKLSSKGSVRKESKRKRASFDDKKHCPNSIAFDRNTQIPSGNFPSPKELSSVNEKTLNQHCNLGYRASHILRLAQKIENGTIKLRAFEEGYDLLSTDKLYYKLLKIKGFGPFACANIMMCIGFYQKIPVDTETIKHLKEVHGMKLLTKRETNVQIYDKMERVDYYEKRFGKLSELPPSNYGNVTGSYIETHDSERRIKE